jgi:hypothetical protein
MGRLLEALRADSTTALPAIPAILGAGVIGSASDNRRIARIADGTRSIKSNNRDSSGVDQTRRLVEALRSESLSASLLSRDDSEPWQLAELDDVGMRAYARALQQSAVMDAGAIPPGYTKAVQCEGCGPVWLWAGCPSVVKACPWCFRRKAKRTFPRPSVNCGDCRHFRHDAINPAGGIGACGVGLPYRSGEIARYPFTLRQCGEHRTDSMSNIGPQPLKFP